MKKRKSPIQPSLFENNNNEILQPEELDKKYFDLFSWAVPLAFSDPLALCRFEEGDTLYNTPKAYLSPWSEALKLVTYGIQVTFPQRAVQKRINEEEDSVFKSNWHYPLELDFLIFENNEFKSKEHIKTTQGTFYTFLWKGDFQLFNSKEHPAEPLKIQFLKSNIKKASEEFIGKIRVNYEFTEAFIIPYDKSSSLLSNKFLTIQKNLKKSADSITVLHERPTSFLEKKFAPTLQLACLLVNSNNNSILYETVKKSIYKPAKNRKSQKDRFRIEKHGILIK